MHRRSTTNTAEPTLRDAGRPPGTALARLARLASIALAAATLGCQTGGDTAHSTWSSKAATTDPTLGPALDVEPVALGTDARRALRSSAIDLLRQAATSTNPQIQANAIEALLDAPEVLPEVVPPALLAENRGVRFVAAMSIGLAEMRDYAHLLEPLTTDPSPSVRAAALGSMRRCGLDVDLSPLSDMVLGTDPETRGNVAMILGQLGDRSAIPLLRSAASIGSSRTPAIRERVVALQIAEALVLLGDERQLQAIRAALFSPEEQYELSAFAAVMCGRLGDAKAVPNLQGLAGGGGPRELPVEVRMAAAGAIARIDPRQAPIDVPLASVQDERFDHRVQAASTLGNFGGAPPAIREQAISATAVLLGDPNPLVQVAAAGSLLELTAAG